MRWFRFLTLIYYLWLLLSVSPSATDFEVGWHVMHNPGRCNGWKSRVNDDVLTFDNHIRHLRWRLTFATITFAPGILISLIQVSPLILSFIITASIPDKRLLNTVKRILCKNSWRAQVRHAFLYSRFFMQAERNHPFGRFFHKKQFFIHNSDESVFTWHTYEVSSTWWDLYSKIPRKEISELLKKAEAIDLGSITLRRRRMDVWL